MNYIIEQRRVLHDRDCQQEERASALYEVLRDLSEDELRLRAGFTASRQVMTWAIIERETDGDQN